MTALDSTLDQLVADLAEEVCEHFRASGAGLDGASLATRLRRRYNGTIPYPDGVERLADLVAHAESMGKVRRDRSVPHLLVLPAAPTEVQRVTPDSSGARYLRPDVWRAFVFAHQRIPLWMDRASGRIVAHRHKPAEDAIRVEPIPVEQQREWMQEFVTEDNLPLDESVIAAEQYWETFPAWLRGQGAHYEFEWRRFRTARVKEYVRGWAEAHGVPFASLLQVSQGRTAVQKASQDSDDRQSLRRAVLNALGEMTLEELEELAIPMRYVLRHFRAR